MFKLHSYETDEIIATAETEEEMFAICDTLEGWMEYPEDWEDDEEDWGEAWEASVEDPMDI